MGAEVAAGAERPVVAGTGELVARGAAVEDELVPRVWGLPAARVGWGPADLPGRLTAPRECPAGLLGRGRRGGGSLSATSRPEKAAARDGSLRIRRGGAAARGWVAVVGGDPPAPAPREIKNAAPKAAKASTAPVATSLTTPTA